MPEKFEIEVPINVSGKSGVAGAEKESGIKKEIEKLNKNTLKLNKTMFLNIDVIEILSSLLGDLFKVLQPLFKLLSLMLLLIFLPLMPIYKDLIKALSKLAKIMGKINKPEQFVAEKGKGVAAIVAGILIAVGAAILFAVGGWILVLLGAIASIIIVFWDDIAQFFKDAWNHLILPTYEWYKQRIMFVWESILLPAWEWFANVPTWIWLNIIEPAFNFLKDVGSWIWEIISKPFRWLADKVNSIISWFGNIGGRVGKVLGFAQGGVVPGPVGASQLAVVHGGERIIPSGKIGGSIIININNPIVRQSSDMKTLANEVSRVLQRQMPGRISSG